MKSKEERWGNETGCVKLLGSTRLSYEPSPDKLNWEDTNHIFQVTGYLTGRKTCLGLPPDVAWICSWQSSFYQQPVINLNRAKHLKTPVWIMVNKALHQSSTNFSHHKLLKSLSSISPSIRQPHSTQGWLQNKKQLLKPLCARGRWSSISILWRCVPPHLQLPEPGDIFHSNRCFYLFIDVCFLK